ncbi:membrane protein G74 [Equid gammaherpesvirus 2]|uniref:G-protein coupled receptor 74 n=2 Tax=Equid gammaherpesvirus 2 TaxID=12657 RepID=VG74_EHV2|nr:membrane protein G74 [Equid gammaherpesvirus 2]Q66673.1 RecName: Full=G-protein coupled receptor 74 [Equid herpesvirus type 2 strain 86/87]AAC13861.1 membrane protein G74 [Equid gammaherpesvirus 2]ABN14134.1 ORF74 [Equid gammaherpesvirus 2]ABN14136.1 ORF74 [Equid gammaherpesvirus 2]ABN14140.1 ORF74 [Equid gammaherpesvirus 2]ABN14141.1 ORF74 [Equid gammaherpesvirus 2]
MESGSGSGAALNSTPFPTYSTPNFTDDYDWNSSDWYGLTNQCQAVSFSKLIVVPCLVILLVFCLIGNLWLLFKLLEKTVKKVSTFILILMCLNSFWGCLCMIFSIVENFAEFSTSVCKLRMVVFWVYVFFDMFLICWLCFDTWCAVWFSVRRTEANQKCWVFCTVALIILAFILSMQKALHVEAIKEYGQVRSSCQFHKETHSTLKVFNVAVSVNVLGFLLPLLFLCIFYGMCLWKLYKAVFKTKTKVIKTMLLFVFMFLLTWGPYYILSFIDGLLSAGYISESCSLKKTLGLMLPLLGLWGMAHGGLQVFIYILCNSHFNKSLFSCFKK